MSAYRLPIVVGREDSNSVRDVAEALPYAGAPIDGVNVLGDNARRAGFAAAALLRYAEVTGQASGEPVDQVIGDLLCDLRHLCDAIADPDNDYGEPLDLDHIDATRGARAYNEEIRGDI